MEDITPGLYWFSCPGWNGPSLVSVLDHDGKLVVSFRRGEMPTPLNRVGDHATFVPSKVEPLLSHFVQKRQKLYLEMAAFYETQDLTLEMCILYFNNHLDLDDADAIQQELYKLKAQRKATK